MADDDSLAIRRELLERLYATYTKDSSTVVGWFETNDADFARNAREVEYLQHKGWIQARIGPDSISNAKLTPAGRDFVEAGGFWSPPPEPPPREAAVRRLGLEGLHAEILKVSSDLFTDGHYSDAIFKACVALEVRVKAMSGLDVIGEKLMGEAFGGSRPLIDVKHEQGESGESEQRGFRFLFMGAMAGIRNPKAHGLVEQSDPQRTLEYLAFASVLMRRLDEATG
jgi:uncharacterized protein (TIGR02391 family)